VRLAAVDRSGGRGQRRGVHQVHAARQEQNRSDRVDGDVQERQVRVGDHRCEGRAVHAVDDQDEFLGRQVEEADGRAGQGVGRRTGARGSVRFRRARRDVEPGAAAPERQQEDQRSEQPAEPLGRVREVDARRAGQKERRPGQIHHQDKVRGPKRMQANRFRDRRHQQGGTRVPGEIRQRPLRNFRRLQQKTIEEKAVKQTGPQPIWATNDVVSVMVTGSPSFLMLYTNNYDLMFFFTFTFILNFNCFNK